MDRRLRGDDRGNPARFNVNAACARQIGDATGRSVDTGRRVLLTLKKFAPTARSPGDQGSRHHAEIARFVGLGRGRGALLAAAGLSPALADYKVGFITSLSGAAATLGVFTATASPRRKNIWVRSAAIRSRLSNSTTAPTPPPRRAMLAS